MRISDWSSDVCSSDLSLAPGRCRHARSLAHPMAMAPLSAQASAARHRRAQMRGVGAVRRMAGGAPESGAALSTRLCGISARSEEHTSELQSLMRISYAVFCLKKKKNQPISKYQPRQ